MIKPSSIDLAKAAASAGWVTCLFRLRGDQHQGQHFYVTGSRPELGGYDIEKAVPLTEIHTGSCGDLYRQAEVRLPRGIKRFSFRIIGLDDNGKLVSVSQFKDGTTLPNHQRIFTEIKLQRSKQYV